MKERAWPFWHPLPPLPWRYLLRLAFCGDVGSALLHRKGSRSLVVLLLDCHRGGMRLLVGKAGSRNPDRGTLDRLA